ncbi:MAG: response regulator [Pseudomonadota bacterium]
MSKKKILIIDDEQNFVEVLKERLEFEGFDVTAVSDGKTGLGLMKKNAYAAVLLDIMMPQFDGFQVKQYIDEQKGNLAHSPIIFVTAYGRSLSREQQQIVGKTPFIRKPFEVKDLIRIINQQI